MTTVGLCSPYLVTRRILRPLRLLFVTIFLLIFSLSMIGHLNMAQAKKSELTQFQWDHRLLLVFAPNDEDAHLKSQIKELRHNTCGVLDRDMLVLQIAKDLTVRTLNGRNIPIDGANLRETYRVDNDAFATVLIGKDGGEKMRSLTVISANDIFEEIDAMPMGQVEMESKVHICG